MPTQITGLTLRQLAERQESVFSSYPQVARYFPAAAMEDARKRLSRTIERGDGPGLVIGAPGTGKSLLLQVLAAQYHERFDVVLLACARLCTRRALLQAVLFELGLPYKLRDEGELRLSLLDHLLSSEQCPAGLLLLVDEAQALPIALLDELRVMTNLVRGGAARVRLVLTGSSALEESFAHPEMESFGQRLSARCYLAPMSSVETMQFIRAQIAAVGGAPDDIFSEEARAAVFDATDGVPRLVNQLCDRALFFAATKVQQSVDRALIQEAWSDLQQLPMPWETPDASPAVPTASSAIEFGGLPDDGLTDDLHVDEAVADTEPTELDSDDEMFDASESIIDPPKAAATLATAVADPFAEKFDEEEVVLDNFAAWDDMFRRGTPRVENRRDPGFSHLVRAAIEASPIAASKLADTPFPAQFLEYVPDELCAEEDDDSDIDLPAAEQPRTRLLSDWPSLRLAFGSDTAPSDQLQQETRPATKTSIGNVAFDSLMSAVDLDFHAGDSEETEEPVLVIEDDAAPSPAEPTVRREEYRNLFSRLRSG